MKLPHIILVYLSVPLASCASGNVRTAHDYNSPPAPLVRHPLYDPYASYGEANAIWRPPVADRNGTIVKPSEPSTQASRPNYESAPWATGAFGGSRAIPPGTF